MDFLSSHSVDLTRLLIRFSNCSGESASAEDELSASQPTLRGHQPSREREPLAAEIPGFCRGPF
jgi:hypothetical protein